MSIHLTPEQTKKRLSPQELGLVYCSAQRLDLNGTVDVASGDEELCLVCIEGSCSYESEEECGKITMADMLYVPIKSEITLKGRNAAVFRFGAPCSAKYSFRCIRFTDVDRDERHKVYGKDEDGSRRDVWNYIDEKFASGRFLTGITLGRAGSWTAWPPHEHGAEREEVYLYFSMGNNFGVQCVYDDLQNADAYIVTNGHLVAIPSGYHPNVGCPCGGIHYVYCMTSINEGERDFMKLRTQKIYGDKLE